MAGICVIPLRGIKEIVPGDSLAAAIARALRRQKIRLRAGDILVVTHKVVSKAEGRVVPLERVKPSGRARRWARRHGGDPRITELVLSESRRIVRQRPGLLITETRHGFVCANSGVDLSNVDGGKSAVLLPRHPDRSAAALRRALGKKLGLAPAVIITDSFGRPWREGLVQVAIGAAGMRVLKDFRGQRDPGGYRLRVTQEAVADELAAAAGLAGDKLARIPVCLIRGFRSPRGRGRARELVRPAARDLFR